MNLNNYRKFHVSTDNRVGRVKYTLKFCAICEGVIPRREVPEYNDENRPCHRSCVALKETENNVKYTKYN